MKNVHLEVGTTPSDSFMLAGFRSRRSPFLVDQLLRLPSEETWRQADIRVNGGYYTATVSGDLTNDFKEWRTPYTHDYPPIANTAPATTRCVNILVTHEFVNDLPLFYVSTVVDVDDNYITKADTENVDTTIWRIGPGYMDEYHDFAVHFSPTDTDGDSSIHVYTHERLPDLVIRISRVSEGGGSLKTIVAPLNLLPATRFVANTTAVAASKSAEKINDIFIDSSGEIHLASPQSIAIGYAENFDFEQEGFPYLGVHHNNGFSDWSLKATAGSFVMKKGRNNALNIFDIGSTSRPKKVLYNLPMTRLSDTLYSLGQPVRSILDVYTETGSSVSIRIKSLMSGTVELVNEHSQNIYADVTVIDWMTGDTNYVNPGPSFDSNYFIPGLAKKDHVAGLWIRPGKYIDGSGNIASHASGSDVVMCWGNEIGNYRDRNGAVIVLTDYTLLGDVKFPVTDVELMPAVTGGKSGSRFQFNGDDLRSLPVDGLKFAAEDVLDVEKRRVPPTVVVEVPEAIKSLASSKEIAEEFRKFVPMGSGIRVEFKT